MLTVEGVYQDGSVRLKQLPEGVRHAHILVTFLDTEGEAVRSGSRPALQEAVAQMRGFFADIPSDRSLADELIAERRQEACRE